MPQSQSHRSESQQPQRQSQPQPQAGIARNVAWKAKQREIENFVTEEHGGRSRVAYLRSPHGTGKSTTLIHHLMMMKTSPLLIYVVPNISKENYVGTYFRDFHPDLAESDGINFQVCRYDTFLDYLEVIADGKGQWPPKVTIVVDVELRASLSGEVFFGKLLELVRQPAPLLSILLMAAHRSDRTTKAFTSAVGSVLEIDVEDSNPGITMRVLSLDTLQTDDFLSRLEEVLSDRNARVIIVTSQGKKIMDAFDEHRPTLIDSEDGGILEEAVAEGTRLLIIKPEVRVTMHIPNLRFIWCDGISKTVLFHTLYGPMVECERYLTKEEVDSNLSWAFKSTLETNKMYTGVCLPDHEMMVSRSDPVSPAWNVHLPWLMLRLFFEWPGIEPSQMPIRRIVDDFAFRDMLRLLAHMGFVKCDSAGYALTTRGEVALGLMKRFGSDLSIHTAYLIAAVDEEPSVKVSRVLIRMAAISRSGIDAFCGIKPGQPRRPDLETIRKMCAGVGASQCWKGGLWVALGMYTKAVTQGEINPTIRGRIDRDGLVINGGVGADIYSMVTELETMSDLPPPESDEIVATALTEDEVVAVERHLMWAWSSRVLCLARIGRRHHDVASCISASIDENTELLDVAAACDRDEVRRFKDVFVLYQRLGTENDILHARDLTFIHPRFFKQEVPGWPTPIISTYPFHKSGL